MKRSALHEPRIIWVGTRSTASEKRHSEAQDADDVEVVPTSCSWEAQAPRKALFNGLGFAMLLLASIDNVHSASGQTPPTSVANPNQIDFTRDIAPIFIKRCTECHGPDQQKSQLRLDR